LIKRSLESFDKDPEFSRNCLKIALALKRKYNLNFPSWFKNMYCKNCLSLLIPSRGAKIRIVGKGKNIKLITTCLKCGRKIRKELVKPIRFKLAQED